MDAIIEAYWSGAVWREADAVRLLVAAGLTAAEAEAAIRG